MVSMLRLDPAQPPLWRSGRTLQFGVEGVLRIDDPPPWQERLLHELERGLPAHAVDVIAVSAGASPGEGAAFLAGLGALVIAGAGAATQRVVLVAARDDPARDGVRDALDAMGVVTDTVDGRDHVPAEEDRTLPRILLAHHALSPERAAAALRDDAPHLPLVLTGGGAVVGPLVIPGATPCVACLYAHRRDADPAWPMLLVQLLARSPTRHGAGLVHEATQLAVRLIRGQGPSDRGRPGDAAPSAHSVSVSVDSARRRWHAHAPHRECACRSLPGSATATGAPSPVRATTRARAFARHA